MVETVSARSPRTGVAGTVTETGSETATIEIVTGIETATVTVKGITEIGIGIEIATMIARETRERGRRGRETVTATGGKARTDVRPEKKLVRGGELFCLLGFRAGKLTRFPRPRRKRAHSRESDEGSGRSKRR
jgi:hypothetical protein